MTDIDSKNVKINLDRFKIRTLKRLIEKKDIFKFRTFHV
jgi:hypothetical protein